MGYDWSKWRPGGASDSPGRISRFDVFDETAGAPLVGLPEPQMRPDVKRRKNAPAPPEPAVEEQPTESLTLQGEAEDEGPAEGGRKLPGSRSMLLIGGLALIALAVVTTPRSDDPQAQLEQGVAAYKAGRTDEARALYREVLEREPANVLAHFNLGVAEQQANRHAQAEEHYRQALRGNPQFAPAMFNLAILLERTDRPEEAAETYQRLIDAHPNEAAAHINLGYLYIQRLDRRADGEAHFRRALELDPSLISRIPEDIRPAVQAPAEQAPDSGSPAEPPPG